MITSDQRNTIAARLEPGDVLIYKPTGIFGRLIRFHTGSSTAGHVEVSIGWLSTIASRDGQGVDLYPLRLDALSYVLRPTQSFNLEAARMWFDHVGRGQKYGWYDLLRFCGYNVDGPGMVCSPCATYVLRAGGIPVFGTVPPENVEPRDFLLTNLLADVTGQVLGAPAGGMVQLVPAVAQ